MDNGCGNQLPITAIFYTMLSFATACKLHASTHICKCTRASTNSSTAHAIAHVYKVDTATLNRMIISVGHGRNVYLI